MNFLNYDQKCRLFRTTVTIISNFAKVSRFLKPSLKFSYLNSKKSYVQTRLKRLSVYKREEKRFKEMLTKPAEAKKPTEAK